MNKLLSIILLLTLSVPSLRSFVTFADYQVNRAYLTTELCENIISDDNCLAPCHLVKEIKKESPETGNHPFTPSDIFKYELLYFENNYLSVSSKGIKNVASDIYELKNFDEYAFSIFHPPKVELA